MLTLKTNQINKQAGKYTWNTSYDQTHVHTDTHRKCRSPAPACTRTHINTSARSALSESTLSESNTFILWQEGRHKEKTKTAKQQATGSLSFNESFHTFKELQRLCCTTKPIQQLQQFRKLIKRLCGENCFQCCYSNYVWCYSVSIATHLTTTATLLAVYTVWQRFKGFILNSGFGLVFVWPLC